MNDNPYVKAWHFNHPPRPEQTDILDFIQRSPQQVLAVDAPTGVGKSPVCITLAVKDGGSILTTQKILQDQYMRDWPHIPLLKGAANYLCAEMKLEGSKEPNCDYGKKRHKCISCPYSDARMKFLTANAGITNYAYAMATAGTKFGVPKKKWLVLDEGHHVENALISAAEVKISAAFCANAISLPFEMPGNTGEAIAFATRVGALAKIRMGEIQAENDALAGSGTKIDLTKIRMFTELERLVGTIEIMMGDNDGEWIFGPFEKGTGFTIKPLMADGLFKNFILPLGERIYITSATLLRGELMAKWLGIEPQNFSFFAVDSPFPLAHRPLYYSPVAPMDYKNYGTSLPRIVSAIQKLMAHYHDKKGIIHTNSFKLSKDITMLLKSQRILAHDETNRDEMLQRHIHSPHPTVLVSPSMTEGVDLPGDLCRFTIFPKVPYASIGDAWTKERAKRDRKWYTWQALKAVIQGCGRAVRNHEDHADAYMLDSCWDRFWPEAKALAPDWFRKSVN